MTTTTSPLRVAVVIGSTRDGRLAPTVGTWFKAQTEAHAPGTHFDFIDVADLDLPDAHPGWGHEHAEHEAELAARLHEADAFVIVTPEYNHSFPAHLKHFIDLHKWEWAAKPVGFVSYGGVSGGLRAVEQLRLVFAELHCVTVRDGVSFHRVTPDHFAQDGPAHDPEGASGAAKVLLDQLDWWAHALRTARAERPYN
ncbi:NADPH-dependent FMN reductase [Streptomyces sp. VRA16 Mangrove soil]|uniref:NADPH-dependent FMN reductase n=1 Tax=Streptomyces sp. VRA16 Mangrove soil TaxID=2817434 RepID=UPI001A9E7C0D|nr:NAD(P)H-dependent oxidoreductase [Streptomyces sp. VRA16 Mangrove soil]MBO1338048.1 NAD(P)H-dependent oxidoreductase [Streptomyces sp. VRA16 Mangrove soil]